MVSTEKNLEEKTQESKKHTGKLQRAAKKSVATKKAASTTKQVAPTQIFLDPNVLTKGFSTKTERTTFKLSQETTLKFEDISDYIGKSLKETLDIIVDALSKQFEGIDTSNPPEIPSDAPRKSYVITKEALGTLNILAEKSEPKIARDALLSIGVEMAFNDMAKIRQLREDARMVILQEANKIWHLMENLAPQAMKLLHEDDPILIAHGIWTTYAMNFVQEIEDDEYHIFTY